MDSELDVESLCLLWAARETGVLDALMTTADTPEAVAAETGVTERAAEVTVAALVDLGFLTASGGAYEPTNRALGFLARRDVRSIGSLPHDLDRLANLLALPETMAGADPPIDHDERVRHHAGARMAVDDVDVRTTTTEAIHAAPTAERILDLRGGPGRYAREFARRGCSVTLVDRPEVIDVVEPLLDHHRITITGVDEGAPLPGGHELVFSSMGFRRFGSDENRCLVERCAAALEPDGVLVAIDVVRDHASGSSSRRIDALAQTSRGDVYAESTVRTWYEDAGFDTVSVRDVPGSDRQAVVGRLGD